MFQEGPNDALSQNCMKLGLLVAENKHRQTIRQDSCFISIDITSQLSIRDPKSVGKNLDKLTTLKQSYILRFNGRSQKKQQM